MDTGYRNRGVGKLLAVPLLAFSSFIGCSDPESEKNDSFARFRREFALTESPFQLVRKPFQQHDEILIDEVDRDGERYAYDVRELPQAVHALMESYRNNDFQLYASLMYPRKWGSQPSLLEHLAKGGGIPEPQMWLDSSYWIHKREGARYSYSMKSVIEKFENNIFSEAADVHISCWNSFSEGWIQQYVFGRKEGRWWLTDIGTLAGLHQLYHR